MRLYPYLCGMKTIKLITLMAFFFCLNIPLYAQFNTVGTINNKRIYTKKPPKPKEAMTDSIVVADSVPDSTTTGNDGDGQTIVTSLDNRNLMSLVALPLETIHINSGFGMRRHPIYHKRIMHNGIDLSARYEKVYSMFPGTVIKVGQDSRSGKFVNAGTNIAISGNTGASTGPHLHLTTKKDGQAINPTIILDFIFSLKRNDS